MPDLSLQPAWLDAQGRREGRYVVGPLLGHGGMGEVFEAWDMVLARPVALKILRHLEPAAMMRFMHEAQLHARLDTPNICRIYDVDSTASGSPRIAMQLVRGPNLEDAAPDLRLGEAVTIIIQVAEALHAAHQQKLIHRDIKPSNILLQWGDKGGWVPYICDFGLAMALDGPSVTQPFAMTGTPAYMAPEQVRGDRSLIGPATDVYGLGSTLYFALVGRPPCVSTVSAEILRVKRERRFPMPRSLEPDIPADLETILLKCLHPDPADRYPTALALAEDLRRFGEGQTILAQSPRRSRRLWLWCRRQWAVLAGGAALASLALSMAVMDRADQQRQARKAQLGQFFALEAATMEQGLRNERMLPVHDLRPAYARTRSRMEALRDRLAALGPEARGPVHYALGRALFFMRDLPAAARELDQAWAEDFRTPEAAFLMARTRSWAYWQASRQASFRNHEPPPEALQALASAEELFRQSRGMNSDPQDFAAALTSFVRKDYPQAAEQARACLKSNPWHLESAVLESLSLSQMARLSCEHGEAERAENLYREALAVAQEALPKGQSEEDLHHARSLASLGLAALALERGALTPGAMRDLEARSDQQLHLNPDNQDAQSDWLGVRCLKVMQFMDLGRDPGPVLEEALQFYWTRTREPRSVELKVDHMVFYLLQAERDLGRGEDPGPALAEALKDPGHALNRHRDFYGDLLNLKARLEAARGRDPRAAVAELLRRFEPLADREGTYYLCEICSEAWLTQAQWEGDHGLDPLPSLHQAQALLQRALQSKPTSASGHALLGQVHVLEARVQPEQREGLLKRAAEHLKWSSRLSPLDRQNARLKELLNVKMGG